MRHVTSSVVFAFALLLAGPALAKDAPAQAAPLKPKSVTPADKCDHGVEKALCTRCNPKLAPVFKKKGDWCGEHERPESQCALCHADLAKKGVK